MIETAAKLLLLALLWSVLALPFLAAAIFAARSMKRRGLTSRAAAVALGLVAALLLAPVPTPIITVFLPNGLALVQGDYYAKLGQDGFFAQLWSWIWWSIAVTATICIAVALRFFSRTPAVES